jgi:pimeloyl-ACP methyl ester carboxylesterase
MGIASAFLESSTAVAEQAFESVDNRITGLAQRVTINGLTIEYEIIGKGEPVVITPGGRFSKETPGVRELAEALARDGKQVLIWDRPNCGGSDVSFEGESESALSADTLAGLLRTLRMAPALVVGGSAGSRVSLLTAARHPTVVSKLFILWISGGPIGLAALAVIYCQGSANAANRGGMEAVAALPEWADSLKRNPANRERILRQDPAKFIEGMQRWAANYFPLPGSPVPGMTVKSFQSIRVPTTVLRSGASDLSHPRKTSEEAHALIRGLFQNWPKLAPQILEFAKKA